MLSWAAHKRIVLTVMTLYLMFITRTNFGEQLSRRKRYVVFPEGSSFSIALCLTVHTLTSDNIFTEGVNWGIAYDLPNETRPELRPFLQLRKDKIKPSKYNDYHSKYTSPANNYRNPYYQPDPYWKKAGKYYGPSWQKKYSKDNYHYRQRRYRRDLYNKMEVVINAMGFDGRSCILRALCEASQRFMPKGNSLVEEMIRIVFALPLKKILASEPEEHHVYTKAHRAGHEGGDCLTLFPACSFSLIDMALGRYSYNPSDNFDSGSSGGSSFHSHEAVERLGGTLNGAASADALQGLYSMK
ncbi:hypothetical protein QAD02_024347 [Eretmocerus hayati]|uniref:Uncharacterized protein n=1 Tax=Eretmocerus hayati TaxID=131215 RepID=A0ACC2PYL6_9HYME|nr:hypothetical protein QAD02_024347 [Eretmocerus hayati]